MTRSKLQTGLLSFFVFFMFMPIATIHVSAASERLIPMGHSIGIEMELDGVFFTNDVMPEKDIWLKSGDRLQQIAGRDVKNLQQLESVLKKRSEDGKITLQLLRGKEQIVYEFELPVLQQIIPFLKDRTEGNGTLTYVDPEKKTYGALGHQIIDSSFNAPPQFETGAIYMSTIDQIKKSSPGNPGYKISTIIAEHGLLGDIRQNSVYGIFGQWVYEGNELLSAPIEVLTPHELKIGPAEIRTTVTGSKVERFSIEITQIDEEQFHFTLNDVDLVSKTGGILQGMSGSPILQNGKFAGAITHMFVDEPEKGAALFLTTMQQ